MIVAGTTTAPPPANVALIRVGSAEEMHQAVMQSLPDATIFIATAAVADYRPVSRSPRKIKKTQSSLSLDLERTPDILRAVADSKHQGLLVIGFAAETEDVLANAQKKFSAKHLDAIVANDITQEGAGFDSLTNEVTIITRERTSPIHVPLMSKTKLANVILEEVVRLRALVESQPVMQASGKA
jgi:phosphopantothenoylcysteine decarboxylase/phosphopantothenate--cysteine ligase